MSAMEWFTTPTPWFLVGGLLLAILYVLGGPE
jgi:hypothetical protein